MAEAHTILGALRAIARGRTDCGRPLAAEASRQLARGALVAVGLHWQPEAGQPPAPSSSEPDADIPLDTPARIKAALIASGADVVLRDGRGSADACLWLIRQGLASAIDMGTHKPGCGVRLRKGGRILRHWVRTPAYTRTETAHV